MFHKMYYNSLLRKIFNYLGNDCCDGFPQTLARPGTRIHVNRTLGGTLKCSDVSVLLENRMFYAKFLVGNKIAFFRPGAFLPYPPPPFFSFNICSLLEYVLFLAVTSTEFDK